MVTFCSYNDYIINWSSRGCSFHQTDMTECFPSACSSVCLYIWCRHGVGKCISKKNLTGKTVAITGANTGRRYRSYKVYIMSCLCILNSHCYNLYHLHDCTLDNLKLIDLINIERDKLIKLHIQLIHQVDFGQQIVYSTFVLWQYSIHTWMLKNRETILIFIMIFFV